MSKWRFAGSRGQRILQRPHPRCGRQPGAGSGLLLEHPVSQGRHPRHVWGEGGVTYALLALCWSVSRAPSRARDGGLEFASASDRLTSPCLLWEGYAILSLMLVFQGRNFPDNMTPISVDYLMWRKAAAVLDLLTSGHQDGALLGASRGQSRLGCCSVLPPFALVPRVGFQCKAAHGTQHVLCCVSRGPHRLPWSEQNGSIAPFYRWGN